MQDRKYAGFWVRLAAFLADIFILLLFTGIFRLISFFAGLASPDFPVFQPILFKYNVIDIIFYCIDAAYFIVATKLFGKTIGKWLFKINVSSATEEPLTWFRVLYRETVGRFLSSILFFGYIFIAISDKKQGFHDYFSDTVVVYDF